MKRKIDIQNIRDNIKIWFCLVTMSIIMACVIIHVIGIYELNKKDINKNESYYQKVFTKHIGWHKTEYRLDDNSRVDIITKTHAIEVDFDYKFYESIGQALFYSLKTGLKPGIVLIVDKKRYLDRLLIVAAEYDIQVWSISIVTEEIISYAR